MPFKLMNLRLIPLIAAVAVLAALGSEKAAAADPIVDPCLLVAPDATLWLGQGIPTVQASAPNNNYGDGPCSLFVVDIQVPANSTGGPGFTPSFSIQALGGESPGLSCELYWEYSGLYRKSSARGYFTYLGYASAAGCIREGDFDNDDVWPSSFDPRKQARITTYRVLTLTGYNYQGYFPYNSFVYTRPTVRAEHLSAL